MYSVHKYMDLNPVQNNYFISQVGAAAASFGVSDADITTVANALNSTFNYKCSPAANITSTTKELQAICIDPSCPLAKGAMNCDGYDAVLAPQVANASLAMGQGVSSAVTLAPSGATSGSAGPAATAASNTASTPGSTESPSFAKATAAPALAAVLAAGAFAFAL